VVFLNFTALLRFWGSVEYRRFTQKKSGLFPDNTFNCENAFAAVEALAVHLGELVLRMLDCARTNIRNRNTFKPFLLENEHSDE
jgi:hypothetical protein